MSFRHRIFPPTLKVCWKNLILWFLVTVVDVFLATLFLPNNWAGNLTSFSGSLLIMMMISRKWPWVVRVPQTSHPHHGLSIAAHPAGVWISSSYASNIQFIQSGSVTTYQTPITTSPAAIPYHPLNPTLPRRKQTEPIRAYKQALLVVHQGDLGFAGIGSGVGKFYRSGTPAICAGGSPNIYPHEVPDEICQCGYYGLKDKGIAELSFYSGCLLEVEFYGKVIAHKKGYRASHQRILSVTFTRFNCACQQRGVEVVPISFPPRLHVGVISFRCQEHASKNVASPVRKSYSMAQISNELGIEARFAD